MKNQGATAGALAIMMASGTIADFEVYEADNETFVRVWSPAGQSGASLQKQVAAILPGHVEERHVEVVS